MINLFKQMRLILVTYPITRGMLSYSILWPSSNLVQQSMDKSFTKYDFVEAFRFSCLGAFVNAPTVFAWIKLNGWIIRGSTIKHAAMKSILDVSCFSPFALTEFFLLMGLFEGKSWQVTVEEWKKKLIPTWMGAACYWSLIQTFNYSVVAEKNRVVAMSCASFVWTIFLSYMHRHSNGESLLTVVKKFLQE